MNFRRILSKSSLKSSSSSGKSLSQSEEILKLQSEIETLKGTLESLKKSVESRDAAIGTLAREKEKLYIELKSVQRTNRNLHQQLIDERDMHSKEKEYLMEDIKRLSKREDCEMSHSKDPEEESESTHSLREEIKSKDEVICNICDKYLKVKFSKTTLQKKIAKLQNESQKTYEKIMLILHDNRNTLDTLLSNLLQAYTSSNTEKYLQLLRVNTNLHFENTQLKVYLVSQGEPGSDRSNSRCQESANKTNVNNKTKSKQSDPHRHSTIFSKVCNSRRNLPYFKNFYKSYSDSCLNNI